MSEYYFSELVTGPQKPIVDEQLIERQTRHLSEWAASASKEQWASLADEGIKEIVRRDGCDYLTAVARYQQTPGGAAVLQAARTRPPGQATHKARQQVEAELHGRITKLQEQAGVSYLVAYNHVQHGQPLPPEAQLLQAVKESKK